MNVGVSTVASLRMMMVSLLLLTTLTASSVLPQEEELCKFYKNQCIPLFVPLIVRLFLCAEKKSIEILDYFVFLFLSFYNEWFSVENRS